MPDVTALTAPPFSVRRMRTAAAQGILWLSSERLGTRLSDQVFTIVLARLLSPREFGLIALATVFTGFLRNFSSMGLGPAIVQRKELDSGHLSSAFWAEIAVAVAMVLVLVASLRLVTGIAGDPTVGLVTFALSFGFILSESGAVSRALILRGQDYRKLSMRTVAGTIAGGSVGVTMALMGLGVWSLVGQILTAQATTTALIFVAAGWRPSLYFSRRKFLELWSFGGPLVLARLTSFSVRNVDNLLVGRFLGSVALGFYSLAYTLFLAPLVDLVIVVHDVMMSSLARLQDQADRLKRAFLMATEYAVTAAFPAMVGLSLVAPFVVEVFFGTQWLPAAPVVTILAASGCFTVASAVVPSALQAAGRTELAMRYGMIAVVLYLPAFAIGLRWGIVGVAAGYLIVTATLAPVQFHFVARVINLTGRDAARVLWPATLSSVVMGACVGAARVALVASGASKPLILMVLVLLGVVVYAGTLLIVKREALLNLTRLVREMRLGQTDGMLQTRAPMVDRADG